MGQPVVSSPGSGASDGHWALVLVVQHRHQWWTLVHPQTLRPQHASWRAGRHRAQPSAVPTYTSPGPGQQAVVGYAG